VIAGIARHRRNRKNKKWAANQRERREFIGFVFIRANSRQAFPITAISAITCDPGDFYHLRFLFSSVFQGFLKVRLK
jgi:hypothetical protein